MILNDYQIAEYAKDGMIEPFETGQISKTEGIKRVSYGCSSYGYDCRIGSDVLVVTEPDVVNEWSDIDPKHIDSDMFSQLTMFSDGSGRYVVLPPRSVSLAATVEYMRIPDSILAECYGKSTYARCGLITPLTPLEPGWEGNVTLELFNPTPRGIRVYIGEGIVQFVFHRGHRPERTYADRKGKYQGQTGVTLPKV